MSEQEITNIIKSMATTNHDFSGYLTPTDVELKKMRICGNCKFNVPFTLAFPDKKVHTRYCNKNDHYVENNSIQLTCWFNKQHLLKNTFLNRMKIRIRQLILILSVLMLASCATTNPDLPFATKNRIGKYPTKKNKPVRNNYTWTFRQWSHEGR